MRLDSSQGTDAGPASATSGTRRWRRALGALTVSLPDRVPVLLLCLGVVSLCAVLLDAFTPLVVVPATIVAIALTARAGASPIALNCGAVLSTVVALVFVAAWVVLNLPYVSEFVIVYRDPGFLALQALWLDDNPMSEISVGAAGHVAEVVTRATASTGAFDLRGDVLYAQGNKMFPAILATTGWVRGEFSVLAGNLAIGGAGLLAVFAVGRRLIGNWWGLVPMAALGLSLPYIWFSRAAYTEPLTMTFVLGGLVVGLSALRTGRRVEYVMTGALLGGAAAARIDGALVVVAMIAALSVVCAATVDAGARRAARIRFGLALTPALLLTALGYWDIRQQSPAYLAFSAREVYGLLAVTGAATVVGIALTAAPGLTGLRLWLVRHRRVLGAAALIAVLVTFAVLASRPLWLVEHNIGADSPVVGAVHNLQLAAGLDVDPRRSYDEFSLSWFSWYLGWHVVLLAAAGLALMLRGAVRDGVPGWFLFVTVVGTGSLYYLIWVSITPDQIWAMRRFVPVAMPGFLLATTWVLARFAARNVRRRVVSIALAMTVTLFPIASWDGLADEVEHRGRYSQASAMCDALDAAGVTRVVWVHSSAFRYLATIRVLCDVEVVEFLETPSAEELQAVGQAWGPGAVAVLTFNVDAVPWQSTPLVPLERRATSVLDRPLTERPTTMNESEDATWMGLLQPDGTVAPLAPSSAGLSTP